MTVMNRYAWLDALRERHAAFSFERLHIDQWVVCEISPLGRKDLSDHVRVFEVDDEGSEIDEISVWEVEQAVSTISGRQSCEGDKFFAIAFDSYWVARKYDDVAQAIRASRTTHHGSTVVRLPDEAKMSEIAGMDVTTLPFKYPSTIGGRSTRSLLAVRSARERLRGGGGPKPTCEKVRELAQEERAARADSLRGLLDAGENIASIAKKLGIPAWKVEKERARLGLKRSRKGIGGRKHITHHVVGERIGLLTAVELQPSSEGRRQWLYHCDCGREVTRAASDIKQLKLASCGCANATVASEARFGMLVVNRRSELRGGNTRWICKCDCGGTTIASTFDLRSKSKVSCGCDREKSGDSPAIAV